MAPTTRSLDNDNPPTRKMDNDKSGWWNLQNDDDVGTRSKLSQGQLAGRFEAGVQERDHGVYQCFAPPHALLAGHAYAKRHCGQDSCQGRSNCREEFGGHAAIVEYDRASGGSGAAVPRGVLDKQGRLSRPPNDRPSRAIQMGVRVTTGCRGIRQDSENPR